jgi:DamX protein
MTTGTQTDTYDQQPTWWQHFGLNQDPFLNNTHAIYLSTEWRQQLELINVLTRHSHELVLLSGIKGVGKSTLLQWFVSELPEDIAVLTLTGASDLTPEKIIAELCSAFGLTLDTEVHSTINDKLSQLSKLIAQKNTQCMLLVDDAHQLAMPVLDLLFYLQSLRWQHKLPLAIMLTVDSEARERTQEYAETYLESESIKSVTLAPLELHEVETYLEQRFLDAGAKRGWPLSREDLLHIHEWSGGVPGRVNNVARQILLDNYEIDEDYMEEGFFSLHQYKIIGALLFITFLAMSYYVWQSQQTVYQPHTQALAIPEQAPLPQAKPEKSMDTQVVAAKPEPRVKPQPQSQPQQSAMTTDLLLAEIEQDLLQQNTQPQKAAKPTAEKLATTAKAVKQAKADEAKKVPAAVEKAAAKSTASIAESKKSIAPEVAKKNTEQATPAKVNTPKVSPKPEVAIAASKPATKPAVVAAKPKVSAAEQYLLDLPSRTYTLQILGSSSLQRVQDYIEQHDLGSQARYFLTKHQGKDWYVVVYGAYQNATEARQAINKLPANVRQQGPWARQVASVQQAIKNRS